MKPKRLLAAAAPDGPQRLRGMEGRSFKVDVELPNGASLFENCYTFATDRSWVDGMIPVRGQWEQHRIGASATYVATLGTAAGLIVQEGTIAPARRGTLRLEATTDIPAGLFGPNPITVVSTGTEVESC